MANPLSVTVDARSAKSSWEKALDHIENANNFCSVANEDAMPKAEATLALATAQVEATLALVELVRLLVRRDDR